MREKWSLRVIGDAECRPPEDNEAASHSQTQNNQHDLATTLPGLKLVYRNSSTLCSETLFATGSKWKQHRCPLTDKWTNNVVYPQSRALLTTWEEN